MVDELASWGSGWFPRTFHLPQDSGETDEMVEAVARER